MVNENVFDWLCHAIDLIGGVEVVEGPLNAQVGEKDSSYLSKVNSSNKFHIH